MNNEIVVEPTKDGGVVLVVGSGVLKEDLDKVVKHYQQSGADVKVIRRKSAVLQKGIDLIARSKKTGEYDLRKAVQVQNQGVNYTFRHKTKRLRKNGPCPNHPEVKFKKCSCYEIYREERRTVRSN